MSLLTNLHRFAAMWATPVNNTSELLFGPDDIVEYVSSHLTLTAGHDIFNVTDATYGAKGDGTTDDRSAINAAATACGSAGFVLFPPGTYRTASALDLSAVAVVLMPGAVLKPDSGMKTTLKVRTASLVKCFDISAGGKVEMIGGDVYPEWWGAVDDNNLGVTSSYTAFRAALDCFKTNVLSTTDNSFAGRVLIQAGSRYYFDNWLIINKAVYIGVPAGSGPVTSCWANIKAGVNAWSIRRTGAGTVGNPYSSGNGAIVEGVYFNALGKTTNAIGPSMSRAGKFINCCAINFKLHGFYIETDLAGGEPAWAQSTYYACFPAEEDGSRGNANNAELIKPYAAGNDGDGIRVIGSNANEILIVNPIVQSNGGWGLYDGSLQGCQWQNPTVEVNTTGAWAVVYSGNKIVVSGGDLNESNGTGNRMGHHTLALNVFGPNGAAKDADGNKLGRVDVLPGGVIQVPSLFVENTDTADTIDFAVAPTDATGAAYSVVANASSPNTIRLLRDTANNRWYMNIGNSERLYELIDHGATTWAGLMRHPNGMVIGNVQHISFSGIPDAPTTALSTDGTVSWNTNTATGQPFYYKLQGTTWRASTQTMP